MTEATCTYHLVANRLEVMSLTLQQRTNHNGWPKAGEMIEMSGTYPLQASDRALLNAIYQFAHDSGRMEDPAAEWEIPLPQLRQGMHESNDRIYEGAVAEVVESEGSVISGLSTSHDRRCAPAEITPWKTIARRRRPQPCSPETPGSTRS